MKNAHELIVQLIIALMLLQLYVSKYIANCKSCLQSFDENCFDYMQNWLCCILVMNDSGVNFLFQVKYKRIGFVPYQMDLR